MYKTNIIYSIILFIFFVHSNLDAQNNWNLLSSPGENLVITSEEVSYKFENNVTGPHHSEALVLVSNDYTQSYQTFFEKSESSDYVGIFDMFFVNSNIGFFSCGSAIGGQIYRTTDGGSTYDGTGFGGGFGGRIFSLDGINVFNTAGSYYDAFKMSYFKKNGSYIYSTSDYIFGTHGSFVSEKPIAELEFVNISVGFITCIDSLGFAYILKTIDTGYNWIETAIVQNQRFSDIKFTADSIGLVIGKEGMVLRTNDCGETWNEILLEINVDLNSIDLNEDGYGVIVGDEGKIFLTNDYGETWEADDFFSSSIDFKYAKVTQSKTLFVHTTEGDLYCNKNILNSLELEEFSFKIIPNPAKDFISISFDKPFDINHINIYSLNGTKILSSVSTMINIQDFESGVYLVQVVSNNNVRMKRVVIL